MVRFRHKKGEKLSFSENLIELRKYHDYSQEELAEMIGVSRQTLSKYETGESLPDIEKCKLLADVFSVTIDDLINYEKNDDESLGLGVPPKGKHVFGMVKVGDKGQIVIPAKARKIFDIQPGDNLIVLGDEVCLGHHVHTERGGVFITCCQKEQCCDPSKDMCVFEHEILLKSVV